MLRKFRKFIGVLLDRPPEHIGPFEAARRDVTEKEYISRQAWEERERMWEAKRRCLGEGLTASSMGGKLINMATKLAFPEEK